MSFEVRVAHRWLEAEDIACFTLTRPDGGELPAFDAGAHIEVRLPGDRRRHYSLSGDPRERRAYEIAVLREPAGRGGSQAMHDTVAVGDALRVSGPYNHFPLAGPEARLHLLLAGGVGITPMTAMIAALEARGAEWHLHYCTRSPDRTAFRARLAPLARAGKVTFHHDGGDPARGLDLPALLRRFEIGTHVYVCGPRGFMAAARGAVGAWPPRCVHFEYFSAPDEAPARTDAAFLVKIKATGQVLEVPADRSIVEVLRAHGFTVSTDCEEGYCGTCITRYVEGEPQHRDSVLGDAERRSYVMICCARAKSPMLVLDL